MSQFKFQDGELVKIRQWDEDKNDEKPEKPVGVIVSKSSTSLYDIWNPGRSVIQNTYRILLNGSLVSKDEEEIQKVSP